LQILDFIAADRGLARRCSLIQAGSFIAAETAHRLRSHLKLKQPLSQAQLDLAQAAWLAYRAPTPEGWVSLLHYDTGALPFLRAAILRHLEEYPGTGNGLSRTESFILAAVRQGVTSPAELWALFQEDEETPFMGDWSFFAILDSMGSGAAPFLFGLKGGPYSPYFDEAAREAYFDGKLRLSGLGMATIDGKKDAIAFRRLDRWMGGVHLSNERCWRWDRLARRLFSPNGRR
jgi:hypothetical protein